MSKTTSFTKPEGVHYSLFNVHKTPTETGLNRPKLISCYIWLDNLVGPCLLDVCNSSLFGTHPNETREIRFTDSKIWNHLLNSAKGTAASEINGRHSAFSFCTCDGRARASTACTLLPGGRGGPCRRRVRARGRRLRCSATAVRPPCADRSSAARKGAEWEPYVGVNRDRRGRRHNSTLLLRRGKEPNSPFGGLHLLPLLLTLLLLQLLSRN
jgi:hypothetical protein